MKLEYNRTIIPDITEPALTSAEIEREEELDRRIDEIRKEKGKAASKRKKDSDESVQPEAKRKRTFQEDGKDHDNTPNNTQSGEESESVEGVGRSGILIPVIPGRNGHHSTPESPKEHSKLRVGDNPSGPPSLNPVKPKTGTGLETVLIKSAKKHKKIKKIKKPYKKIIKLKNYKKIKKIKKRYKKIKKYKTHTKKIKKILQNIKKLKNTKTTKKIKKCGIPMSSNLLCMSSNLLCKPRNLFICKPGTEPGLTQPNTGTGTGLATGLATGLPIGITSPTAMTNTSHSGNDPDLGPPAKDGGLGTGMGLGDGKGIGCLADNSNFLY